MENSNCSSSTIEEVVLALKPILALASATIPASVPILIITIIETAEAEAEP